MKSGSVTPVGTPGVKYREILRPPLWLLAFIYFLLMSLAISIWASLGNMPGVLSFIVLTALLFMIANRVTMTIEISEDELIIGRAHIERKFLGEVIELNPQEMRLMRGRDADPAAFLAIRFWQDKGVRIQINDDRDPTPYWLVSSKRSEKLKRTLYTLQ